MRKVGQDAERSVSRPSVSLGIGAFAAVSSISKFGLVCCALSAVLLSMRTVTVQGQPVSGQQPVSIGEKPLTSAEIERFSALHRTFYHAAVRGTEWLARQQRAEGCFAGGLVPCLDLALENGHYLRQVQATLALAQAARLTGNEKWASQAKQAVLWLLAGTSTDGQNPAGRYPRPPLVLMSRLGTAGWLIAAIHELPQPAQDLLDPAEELAYWIQRQQQPDGTFRLGELGLVGTLPEDIPEETDPLTYGPGPALWGMAKSLSRRPQAWKLDMLRRARAPYYRMIQEIAQPAEKVAAASAAGPAPAASRPLFAVWHLAAWSETYAHTRERAFAEYVFELADALLTLQYTDPSKPLYLGGFALSWADKARLQPPDWQSAYVAWALTLAARTARQLGDQARYTRYVLAAEGALQFVTTLQYTALNTGHFAEAYQPKVIGGFRTGLRDGTIRLQAQQAALTALWTYLETIVCSR